MGDLPVSVRSRAHTPLGNRSASVTGPGFQVNLTLPGEHYGVGACWQGWESVDPRRAEDLHSATRAGIQRGAPMWRSRRTMLRIETETVTRVTLSEAQARMLLFFAGVREDPYGDARTTSALIARDLLTFNRRTGRYRASELGQRIAAQLQELALDDTDPR
jgi:hypothetical protein